MRADGRDHDGRNTGVDHGGAGGHSVSGAARGRGHDQPVALHGRDVLAVEEQVDVGEVGRRSSVDHHLVQHQEVHLLRLALLLLPHDDATQATPQRQRCVPFQHVRDLLLEVVELEGSQEAQRAQVERHDRRD